jgi:hypothetical protein
MFGPFALCILVGNPYISFGIRHCLRIQSIGKPRQQINKDDTYIDTYNPIFEVIQELNTR